MVKEEEEDEEEEEEEAEEEELECTWPDLLVVLVAGAAAVLLLLLLAMLAPAPGAVSLFVCFVRFFAGSAFCTFASPDASASSSMIKSFMYASNRSSPTYSSSNTAKPGVLSAFV